MSKAGRLFIQVDINFFTCVETLEVGRDVAWTFLELLAYSKATLSDGLVPLPIARRLGGTPEALQRMTDVGWVGVGDRYVRIVAYEAWNDVKGLVKEKNQARAERQRRYREKQKAELAALRAAVDNSHLASSTSSTSSTSETETETETETESHASRSPSRNASRNASRVTRPAEPGPVARVVNAAALADTMFGRTGDTP